MPTIKNYLYNISAVILGKGPTENCSFGIKSKYTYSLHIYKSKTFTNLDNEHNKT